MEVADKFLDTEETILEKSNEDKNTSSTFLRNLDQLAVYLTSQSTKSQKTFKKKNIALASQNISNSFTFVAKDKNNFLDIESFDGERTNQISLAKLFVPQSLLIKAKTTQVYSFVYRSALLFSQPSYNDKEQSIVMAASVPERKITNLQEPVVITFQDQNANKTRRKSVSTCHFWVPEKNGICMVFLYISLIDFF